MTIADHPVRPRRPVVTPPDVLDVVKWADPLVEVHGFPVTDPYVETCYLPRLGPSATLALRRLGAWVDGGTVVIDTGEFAALIGIPGAGARSPLTRTLHRLTIFRVAKWRNSTTLAVRTHVAPLSAFDVELLPGTALQYHYDRCPTTTAP